MKILYIHQYFVFPDRAGGTRSYDLSTSFVSKGYEVEIITSSALIQNIPLKKGWNLVHKDDLILHILKLDYSNEFSYLKRTFVFLKFLLMASIKAVSIKCDLLIATSTPLTIGIPAVIKKWIHNTPFVFEVRDVWPEAVIAIGAVKNKLVQTLLYKLEAIIYKNASAIVPLSIDMKESIIRRYPKLNKKSVEVIENISQLSRFGSFDPERNLLEEKLGFKPKFSVVYAGTFGKVNGISFVIELASRLVNENKDITFILVGPGAEKQNIVNKAKDLDIYNKNVFIWDSIPKQDLPQLYYEANMGSSFVINIEELWANSANKFFDTLAAGKPILINYGGWQKKVINECDLGYVLPTHLSEEAVIAFLEYVNNEELQTGQRKNALQKAKDSYSLEVAAGKYLKIIERLI